MSKTPRKPRRPTIRAAVTPSYCAVPGCVEEARGRLYSAYAPFVDLCDEHLRPIRATVLQLMTRRRPDVDTLVISVPRDG